MRVEKAYSFDDLLLVPKYSEITSRSLVSTKVDLGKGFVFDIPIISSNMTNVTEVAMALALARVKGMAILHRFCTVQQQVDMFKECLFYNQNAAQYVGASIGVKEEDKSRLDALILNGCKIICIDVAHGYSKVALDMTNYIADKYPEVLLISGNAAEGQGALAIACAGADVVKVGVGSGSICTTRIQTGNGIPMLTALQSTHLLREEEGLSFKIISDGGCKNSGDMVKALAIGADMIMAGSLLAGTPEAPGAIYEIDGIKYKEYSGSSTHKGNHIEGVKALVPLKSSVTDVIQSLVEGIKSGCSYQGVDNLEDLKVNPEFMEVSYSGFHNESKSHSVKIRE